MDREGYLEEMKESTEKDAGMQVGGKPRDARSEQRENGNGRRKMTFTRKERREAGARLKSTEEERRGR